MHRYPKPTKEYAFELKQVELEQNGEERIPKNYEVEYLFNKLTKEWEANEAKHQRDEADYKRREQDYLIGLSDKVNELTRHYIYSVKDNSGKPLSAQVIINKLQEHREVQQVGLNEDLVRQVVADRDAKLQAEAEAYKEAHSMPQRRYSAVMN